MCVCMRVSYFTKISKCFVLPAFPLSRSFGYKEQPFGGVGAFSICAIGVSGLPPKCELCVSAQLASAVSDSLQLYGL